MSMLKDVVLNGNIARKSSRISNSIKWKICTKDKEMISITNSITKSRELMTFGQPTWTISSRKAKKILPISLPDKKKNASSFKMNSMFS